MSMQGRNPKVVLTPEQERSIAARVTSGGYRTATEVVQAALHLQEQSETGKPEMVLQRLGTSETSRMPGASLADWPLWPGMLGGSKMGLRVQAHDWAATRLGPPGTWPRSLLTLVAMTFESKLPALLAVGPDLLCLHNDGYLGLLDANADVLGRPFRAVWPDTLAVIDPVIRRVLDGEARYLQNAPFKLLRDGHLEESYFDFSFSPVRDDRGVIIGFLNQAIETTGRALAERRQTFRIALDEALHGLGDPREIMATAAERLGRQLSADRAGYAEIEAGGEFFSVERDWCAPGMPSLAGRHHLADFGPRLIAAFREGHTIAFEDALTEPLTQSDAATAVYRDTRVRAAITAPLVKDGVFAAALYVHHSVPRQWTEEDKALVSEVAERTWAAVEHVRAEAEKRAGEAHWRGLFEQLHEGFVIGEVVREPDGQVVDWRCRDANPAGETLFGLSRDTAVGRTIRELIPGIEAEWVDEFAQVVETGRPATFTRQVGVFGRWYEGHAFRLGPERFAMLFFEVTERKRAEEALRLLNETLEAQVAERTAALEVSEARMRAIFETSYQYQGLLTCDGTLVDANASSLKGIEATLGDVVGKPFWDTPWFTGTPGMSEAVRQAISRTAAGETFQQEFLINLPTGRRAFHFSLRPVMDRQGRVTAIVPEAVDITEQRQTEEALRQSQKMEAVGQLAGGLAHDFNNLLTGIIGSLELMQMRVAQGRTTDLGRYVTAATASASRAAALTHRLLAFSRRQTLDPKRVMPNRLVAGMEELLRRTVGSTVTVRTALGVDAGFILCDPNQLESALLNLAINARDAMPEGGRLTIETANVTFDRTFAAQRDVPPGHYVALSVTDGGTGMPPDVITRAFEPFFTTKPIGQGTGLGLSMVYGFAQQSGGQVRIHSQEGIGTTVTIYLPRDQGTAKADVETSTPTDATRADSGETVLVVDDEPVVRMLIVEALEELGYAALAADSGRAGLRQIEAGRRIDLLVTDVGLPGGMNGRQLADAARVRCPGLKVLFITGFAESVAVGNSSLEPGMEVLTKPFAMEALTARVRAMITGQTLTRPA